MAEANLVQGFEQNKEEEEKEEITRYGLKKKHKAKKKIEMIITVILGIIIFCIILYIVNLKKQLEQKEFEIKIITQNNKDLVNSLMENKENIDKMGGHNIGVQNKAFSLLNKCFNETNSLSNEINELKDELLENERINKLKINELIKKNNDLRDKMKYMNDYYNIC